MRIKNLLLISLIAAVSMSILSVTVYADSKCTSEEDCNKQIDQLQKKVITLQGKADSLSSEIAAFDNQIALAQLRIQNSLRNIAAKEIEIANLEQDIANISTRIDKLQNSIAYQQNVFDQRVRAQYKTRETSPIIILFGSNTLNTLVKKEQYLNVMELEDQRLLTQMNATKASYTQQKQVFQDTKAKTEALKAQLVAEERNLESYKANLNDQQDAKQRLLDATQNDQAKYQKLLDQAQAQLNSFTSFVTSAGGGVISANGFGSGKLGWYMSQRDERWASSHIGNSSQNIFNVGCLVTSIAMVYKHYGSNVTPQSIANQTSRFFGNTALMLIPWSGPGGRSYTSISVSQINSELDSGRPVIVGIYYGTFGTHFVVLSSRSGSDWITYDPYYGPDQKFSSRYSKNSIFQAVVFK
ncbi:MAG TPA: C39 family peptidase [Candidatus Saccharimonadales bacterium]|nr:C39 family peptidase [Candidatus Saccharimonadales bacterium]